MLLTYIELQITAIPRLCLTKITKNTLFVAQCTYLYKTGFPIEQSFEAAETHACCLLFKIPFPVTPLESCTSGIGIFSVSEDIIVGNFCTLLF